MRQNATPPSNHSSEISRGVAPHGAAGLSVMEIPPSMIGVGRIGRGGVRLIRHLNRMRRRGIHEKSAKGVSHA